MKKMFFVAVLATAFLQPVAFAEQKQIRLNEKWVGVMWKEGEKPIVLPVLSDTEKECFKLINDLNDITKNTVKVDRQVSCQRVIVK